MRSPKMPGTQLSPEMSASESECESLAALKKYCRSAADILQNSCRNTAELLQNSSRIAAQSLQNCCEMGSGRSKIVPGTPWETSRRRPAEPWGRPGGFPELFFSFWKFLEAPRRPPGVLRKSPGALREPPETAQELQIVDF